MFKSKTTQSSNFDYTNKTLKDLCTTGHSYWKFTQSEPGRSEEKLYAEYTPGQITKAEDPDKKLSFADEKHVITFHMYGDQLTELVIDKKNKQFKEIANNPIKLTNASLGEIETEALLVKANYSLKDRDTLIKIIEMTQNDMQLYNLFSPTWPIFNRLMSFGFKESANIMYEIYKQLYDNLNKQPFEEAKAQMLHIIKEY